MHMLTVTTDPNNDTSTHRYTPTGDILETEHSAASYDRSYYGHDAMGSVTDTLKGDGTPAWKHAYEPFGATTNSTPLVTGAVDTNFGYTSAYQEPTLGAEYALRARDYNPTNGRFTSTDPLTPAPTDPAISPYLYVNNQPTVLVDPTGLAGCEPGGTPDPWCALSRWLDEGIDAAEPAFEFGREISGVNDAEDCLRNGDGSACAWTAASVIPISRLGKAGESHRGNMRDRRGCTEGSPRRKTRNCHREMGVAAQQGVHARSSSDDPEAGNDRRPLRTRGGSFVSPKGTPFGQRSLPPDSASAPYRQYEVVGDLEVRGGITAPWFGQSGGGIQYELPGSVADLISRGILKPVR